MPTLEMQGTRDPALEGLVKIPGVPETLAPISDKGHWPRMLQLSEETKGRLVEYLSFEISEAWRERSLLAEDWIQWQKDYWAKPEQAQRNFPFKKAANIVIPLSAIAVEAIYARLLNTLFSVKPFWSIRPKHASWIDGAPVIEKWFQSKAEDQDELDAYGFASSSLLELVKFGTGIGKSGYHRDIRKVNVDLPDGTTQERWIEKKNGATLDYVPLANYLQRAHENDPQVATWCGEEHFNYSWSQMKREALGGRIDPDALEAIRTYWSSGKTSESNALKVDEVKDDLQNLQPGWNETFDFQEIWLSFDVDGDGVDEEIVVDFHHKSSTILSCRYNWYADLHRPYRIGVYMPVEGRWAGIGVGKQSEQFQPLITTVHRQRLDAGTLANMGQIAIKRSSGYGPGEPMFPGKLWFLENVDDIKEFSLSNHQHFSQIQNESTAKTYYDQRVGIHEMNLGATGQGTPAPASTDLTKLAESNKKFDMVMRNVKRWYGQLGVDVLQNYQQFGYQDQAWLQQDPDGIWIEQFLEFPAESVRKGAIIELTVTDSITNQEVEQQKMQGVFAILTQHNMNVVSMALNVAQVTGDWSAYMQLAPMALRSSNEITRRLLKALRIPDVENFVLDLRPLDAPIAGGTAIAPGTSPGVTGTNATPGMAQLPALTGIGDSSPFSGSAGVPR